jgi:hypothetical protein
MYQTQPTFPLFMPSSLVITSWPTSQPNSPASQSSPTLATGFAFLVDLDLPEALDLLNVLHNMRDITLAFDAFQRSDPEAPPIKMIIFARNLNQHELLTLPDLSGELFSDPPYLASQSDTQRTREALAVYELTRLAALVYQITVLLPNLHSDTAVTIPYAHRIKRCLHAAITEMHMHESKTYADLFLWVATLTAWLVHNVDTDTGLYAWFLDFLVAQVHARNRWMEEEETRGNPLWADVRDVLASFLWLESECAAPCAGIWADVETSLIPDERCVVL